MKDLIAAFEAIIKVDSDLEGALHEAFIRKEIKKGDRLLREGQYCKHLYFLESGLIRCFCYEKDTEVNTWFYKEDNFVSSWYSFYSDDAGYETIEALEDSVVYALHKEKYNQLLDQFPIFERFARILAQDQVAIIDSFSKGYMFLSAKEKYQLTLQYFPDIEQRVKLGQIASFLGISQETLSRIRGSKG